MTVLRPRSFLRWPEGGKGGGAEGANFFAVDYQGARTLHGPETEEWRKEGGSPGAPRVPPLCSLPTRLPQGFARRANFENKSPGKLEMKKCSKFLANFFMSTFFVRNVEMLEISQISDSSTFPHR